MISSPSALLEKNPARLPLRELLDQAREHANSPRSLNVVAPIATDRFFICPTATPLYYTSLYRKLSEEQARRYNQLTALSFNELIMALERSIAPVLFAALRGAAWFHRTDPPSELVDYFEFFEAEERRHLRMWQALNQLAEPKWYEGENVHFFQTRTRPSSMLRTLCSRPHLVSTVLWIMLLQEEMTMELARRCARSCLEPLEPRFGEAYRLHVEDEVRHVQIDWYVIEHLRAAQSPRVRRLNARIVRFLVKTFFLAPRRLAVKVAKELVREFPSLRPSLSRMQRELKGLGSDLEYQHMMYSRRSHPISFHLFDCYPEFEAMRHVLFSYQPGESSRAQS